MGSLADDPVIKLLVENHWSKAISAAAQTCFKPAKTLCARARTHVRARALTRVHVRAWGVPTLPNLALQHCKYLNVMFCLSLIPSHFRCNTKMPFVGNGALSLG